MSCWCNNLRVNCLGVRTCDSLLFFFFFRVGCDYCSVVSWVFCFFCLMSSLTFTVTYTKCKPKGILWDLDFILLQKWSFLLVGKHGDFLVRTVRESFQRSGSVTLWLSSFMYTGRKHWDCIVNQWGTNTTGKPGCGGTPATSYWTRETSRGTAEINWIGDPRAPDEKRSSHQETATGAEVVASAAATGHTSSKID